MSTKGTKYRWLTGTATIVVIAVTGMTAPSTQAAWPDTSAFNGARELSDSELSGMRGRFVSSNTILYFGVAMSTEWRTSTGELLSARANLDADVSGAQPKVTFVPTITAVTLAEQQQQQPGNVNSIVSNNATGNGTGAQQVIQIAGDGNRISNRFEIEVYDNDRGQLTGSGGNGISELTTVSGARLSVENRPGKFGINIEMPGHGNTTQQLVPSQGLRQLVQLNSNLQQINNVTTLRMQIQQQAGANLNQLRSAIRAARNLPRIGG